MIEYCQLHVIQPNREKKPDGRPPKCLIVDILPVISKGFSLFMLFYG